MAKIVIAVLIVTGVLAAGDQPTIGALERSFPAHVQPAEDRAQLRTDAQHRYEHLHCLRAAYRLSLDPAQCPWVR